MKTLETESFANQLSRRALRRLAAGRGFPSSLCPESIGSELQ
jgi:hypothetical protein